MTEKRAINERAIADDARLEQRGLGVVPRSLSVFRVQIYKGALSPEDVRDIFKDGTEDAGEEEDEEE